MQHIRLERYLAAALADGQIRKIREQRIFLRHLAALSCQLPDMLLTLLQFIQCRLFPDLLFILVLPLLQRLSGSLLQLLQIRPCQRLRLFRPAAYRLPGGMQCLGAQLDCLPDALPLRRIGPAALKCLLIVRPCRETSSFPTLIKCLLALFRQLAAVIDLRLLSPPAGLCIRITVLLIRSLRISLTGSLFHCCQFFFLLRDGPLQADGILQPLRKLRLLFPDYRLCRHCLTLGLTDRIKLRGQLLIQFLPGTLHPGQLLLLLWILLSCSLSLLQLFLRCAQGLIDH